jgi:DNA (cytosine-5)-methyltransferase 1
MPRLLDGCCGEGGASRGYVLAGWEVEGVDVMPMARYPYTFHLGDALEYIAAHADEYDGFHVSPPCPAYSTLRTMTTREHPRLVEAFREVLEATGKPYVIENVPGAPLRNPVTLCGSSFGLGAGGRQLRRHRDFECNFPVMAMPCQHRGQPVGVYGTGGGGQMTRGYKATPAEAREAIGMPWGSRAGVAQAIPPAYTEHLGAYMLAELAARAAA